MVEELINSEHLTKNSKTNYSTDANGAENGGRSAKKVKKMKTKSSSLDSLGKMIVKFNNDIH